MENNILDRLRESKGWRGVFSVMRHLLAIITLVLLFAVFINVVLRKVFEISMPWVEEVITIASVWMYFVGAVVGTEEESHVKGDLLTTYIHKPKTKKFHTVFINVYSAVVTTIFAYWLVKYVIWVANVGMKTAYLRIPLVTSQGVLGVCIPLMAALFIFHSIRYALRSADRFAPPPDEEPTPEEEGDKK